MKTSYDAGHRIAGIVYLHRINDTRMLGSVMLTFAMFQRMVGTECSRNIVLGTTFWDSVDQQAGATREIELQTVPEFWGSLYDKGSKVTRMNDKESIIQLLLSIADLKTTTLQIQDEMAKQDMQLLETGAGLMLQDNALKTLKAEHQATIEQASTRATEKIEIKAVEVKKELEIRSKAQTLALKARLNEQKREEKAAEKARKLRDKEHAKDMKQAQKEAKNAEAEKKSNQLKAEAEEKALKAKQERERQELHLQQAKESRGRSNAVYQRIGMQLQWLKVRRKKGKVSARWTNRNDKKAINKAYTRLCDNCCNLIGEGIYWRKRLPIHKRSVLSD